MSTEIKNPKKEKKKLSLKDLRDKYREKVRVKFKFDEAPGQILSFMYREFKEDQMEKYTLADGQIYDLPLGVVRHINNRLNYPVHAHMKSEDGSHNIRIGQKVQRASCQSLEFVDVEDIGPSPGITTVEMAY